MKIMFLDIDGVMVVGWTKRKLTQWGEIHKFDKKSVKQLNEILEVTGAEIVLSSDWKKHFTLKEMREIFEWNGVIRGPIAFTINSALYEEAQTNEWMVGARAFEIKEYVERHGLTDWCAIDDLRIHDSGLADFFDGHFIHCGRSNEGLKQTGIKDKVLKILLDEKNDELEAWCKICESMTGPLYHGGCDNNNDVGCPWISNKKSSKVDWDKRYMGLAEFYASWSKDRKTGVGCVIVNDEKTDMVKGYNGFPRGANDDVEERHDKPAKYDWTEHSERNAIYKAAREGISTKGCSMYVTYFPCVECSRAIIQAGIKRLIAPKPDLEHEKWGESWITSIEMLNECGVEITYFSKDERNEK